MTTTAERDFVSIGILASQVGRTVRTIEKTADALAIAPAMRINSVPYFSAQQVEQLTVELTKGNK